MLSSTAAMAETYMWMSYGQDNEIKLWLTQDLCEVREARDCVLVAECDGSNGYGTEDAASAFWRAIDSGKFVSIGKPWLDALSAGSSCFYQ